MKEKQKAEKEAKMKISPKELFSTQTDKYSEFNEDGFPTKDKDGKEITKVIHLFIKDRASSRRSKKSGTSRMRCIRNT